MTGLLIAIALFSPGTPAEAPKAGTTAQVSSHHWAAFTLKAKTSFDDVAKNPTAFGDKTVLVSAKIKSVCQKKGCWLVLEGTTGASARVTMKDYGFFAPLDCDGKQVLVEGKVAVKTLAEAERKHLAEDGKTTIDAVPKHELRIEATGLKVI